MSMSPTLPVSGETQLSSVSWEATSRYDIRSAPGGLGLVQDLENTISASNPRQPDLLQTLDDAKNWLETAMTRWADATGCPNPRLVLDEQGLRKLRTLRDDLRRTQATRDLRESPNSDTAPIGVHTAITSLRLDAGHLQLVPRGQNWHRLLGVVLLEAYQAQTSDTWKRLKVCRNTRCQVAFYDRSRNNSGTWHDVRTCGNSANLAASRARRRLRSQGRSPSQLTPAETDTSPGQKSLSLAPMSSGGRRCGDDL